MKEGRKMTVSPVSFGKITLVKAPLHAAENIALMANKRNKTELGKQVKTIINDTKYGKAHAYPSGYLENVSYIFSGKEGRKYNKLFTNACERANFVQSYFRDNKIADSDIQFTWRRFDEQVEEELIKPAKDFSVMDVEYNKLGDIKSVNIIA
jgi:hypothetical protein